jgi:hypothetical protein
MMRRALNQLIVYNARNAEESQVAIPGMADASKMLIRK